MKNPGIKIPYLSIEKPLPEGTRCIEVRIPDDDEFVPVLGGLVAIATKWFNYDRDSTHKGAQIARLWRMAYLATDWEGCMSCEELTECLQPLFDNLQTAIINQVNNFNEYGVNEPGVPLTEEQYEQDLTAGTNPTCDLDIVWAQCLAVVQFTNRLITDLMEQIESKSNVVELAQLFNSLPFVRYITNAIGEEAAVDLIAYYQEAFTEGYLAEYTEAIETEIACQLFCYARLDCTISVSMLDSVFSERVASIVPDTPGDLIELLTLLAGISISSADVVNLMFWMAWKGAVLAEFFISDAFSGIFNLQTLLNLAVDNASSDWELLCTTCPNCDIGYEVVIGTEGATIVSVVMEVEPLTAPGTLAWARRIIILTDSPVNSVTFDYNYGGGTTGDVMYCGFSSGVTTLAQSGHASIYDATPGTGIIIDLGYSGSPTAYDDSPAFIENLVVCADPE